MSAPDQTTALLLELRAELAALRGELAAMRQENAALRSENTWLKRQVFGPGRSEKLERLQAELPFEQTPVQAVEPKVETVSYERLAAPREKRAMPAEVFRNLPVKETVVIEPEEVKARPELY